MAGATNGGAVDGGAMDGEAMDEEAAIAKRYRHSSDRKEHPFNLPSLSATAATLRCRVYR
jgi:hypothetical protein